MSSTRRYAPPPTRTPPAPHRLSPARQRAGSRRCRGRACACAARPKLPDPCRAAWLPAGGAGGGAGGVAARRLYRLGSGQPAAGHHPAAGGQPPHAHDDGHALAHPLRSPGGAGPGGRGRQPHGPPVGCRLHPGAGGDGGGDGGCGGGCGEPAGVVLCAGGVGGREGIAQGGCGSSPWPALGTPPLPPPKHTNAHPHPPPFLHPPTHPFLHPPQIDAHYDKLRNIGEYIEDTEEYINIELDAGRNRLIRLDIVLTAASFAIAPFNLMAGGRPRQGLPLWRAVQPLRRGSPRLASTRLPPSTPQRLPSPALPCPQASWERTW